jgi:hypothetical protein
MPVEPASLAALVSIAGLIAIPAFDAWRRRFLSREASAVAAELQLFAAAVRAAQLCVPLDPDLRDRVAHLRVGIPEVIAFLLTQQLSQLAPEAVADAAQRLALRLRRRVAFERKMLARTTSGLRRGAIAAALPPLLIIGLAGAGLSLPAGGLLVLFLLEALGCWLLWRLARVEI